MTTISNYTYGRSRQDNPPYIVSRIIDFAKALEIKGSPLAQGDIIEVFQLPANSVVSWAAVKVVEAANSSTLVLDLGTASADDDYVSNLDGKSLGYSPDKNATTTFRIVSDSEPLQLTIAGLTGTLTSGKVVVYCHLIELKKYPQTETVIAVPPVNTVAPTFTGDPYVDEILTATGGSWDKGSISRLWQRSLNGLGGWSNIGSGLNYTVKIGDVDFYIRYVEISTVPGATASAVTTPIGPVELDNTPPVADGLTFNGSQIIYDGDPLIFIL